MNSWKRQVNIGWVSKFQRQEPLGFAGSETFLKYEKYDHICYCNIFRAMDNLLQ